MYPVSIENVTVAYHKTGPAERHHAGAGRKTDRDYRERSRKINVDKSCFRINAKRLRNGLYLWEIIRKGAEEDRLCSAARFCGLGFSDKRSGCRFNGKIWAYRLVQASEKRDIDFAEACLDKVGMLDYAKRQISQLSG